MHDITQFINQFSQLIAQVFKQLNEITSQIFQSGFLKHIWPLIQGMIKLLIVGLEALVNVLKFFIK